MPSIVVVINYTCPNHPEDYIHRIGRTGRARTQGTAITFITQAESKYAYDLVKVLEYTNHNVTDALRELAFNFKKKVEDGEIKSFRARGFGGKGY